MGEVWLRATQYEVSVFPDSMRNDPSSALDAHQWVITVADRGEDRWAVIQGPDGSHCMVLGTDGDWDMEPRPSSRSDEWIATHRFSYEDAIRHARDQAAKVTFNGLSAAGILRRHQP